MNVLDRIIGAISPGWGARRMASRMAVGQMTKMLDAGKHDRTSPHIAPNTSGEIRDQAELIRARDRAWRMYFNDSNARKFVDQTVAHVVGCGQKPQSKATKPNGEPDASFRQAANDLFRLVSANLLYNPTTGAPSMPFGVVQAMVMKEVAICGEVAIRKRYLSRDRAVKEGRVLPIAIELITTEHFLDSVPNLPRSVTKGNYIFRGIEFDPQGNRVAYHIRKMHPSDPRTLAWNTEIERVPASEILHVFRPQRPESIRGVTWMSSLIQRLQQIRDYEETELIAATVSACVAMAITRPSGSTLPSLQNPTNERTVDADGNPITRMQPGMFLDLRPGQQVTGFNPQRPNTSADAFIGTLMRGASLGMPGIKSSTVTADYRNSSFSSERSAENDAWREIEIVQEWFAAWFCQPIWEFVIETGLTEGWFREVLDGRSFRLERAIADKQRVMSCEWMGPVPKSINPADDERASQLAIQIGTSSLPIECAARGLDWEQVMEDQKRVADKRKELGIADPDALAAGVVDANGKPLDHGNSDANQGGNDGSNSQTQAAA